MRPSCRRRGSTTPIRPWLAASSAAQTVATWGNHDWCGEACRFGDAGGPDAGRLRILVDAETTITAGDEALTVWAAPWSNHYGHWAFMKAPADLAPIYARIPEGIDILVSHQPPYGYGDLAQDHQGSRELLAAIERVRPRAVICGHIHEGHGRDQHQGIPIYNVAVVNEFYELVHEPTVIELAASRAARAR